MELNDPLAEIATKYTDNKKYIPVRVNGKEKILGLSPKAYDSLMKWVEKERGIKMPKMTILIGIAGSGKSTFARRIALETGAYVLSADNWHTVQPESNQVTNEEYNEWRCFNHGDFDGNYVFVPGNIGYAHGQCQKYAEENMKLDRNIVIANTNILKSHRQIYKNLANVYKYEVSEIYIPCDVETAFSRNVHGVPKDVIQQMYDTLELPDGVVKQCI